MAGNGRALSTAARCLREFAQPRDPSSRLRNYANWRSATGHASVTPPKGKGKRALEPKAKRMTMSLLERAAFDLEAVEKAKNLQQPVHSRDLGWKRTGTPWKARRGSMIDVRRRGYASLVPTAAEGSRTTDHAAELAPGDLVYADVSGKMIWAVILSTDYSGLEATRSRYLSESVSYQYIMDQTGQMIVIGLPQVLACSAGHFARSPQARERIKASALSHEELEALATIQDNTTEESAQALEDFVPVETLQARAVLAARLRKVIRDITVQKEVFRPHLFQLLNDPKAPLLNQSEVEVSSLARTLQEMSEASQEARPSTSANNYADASSFSTHELLMSTPHYFMWQAKGGPFKHSSVFAIRPQHERQLLEKVNSWFNASLIGRETPLQTFLEKAKQRLEGQNHPDWCPTDKDVLAFLIDALSLTFVSQGDPYFACTSHILKELGRVSGREPERYVGEGPNLTVSNDFDWVKGGASERHVEVCALLLDLEALAPAHLLDWTMALGPSRRLLEGIASRKAASQGRRSAVRDLDYDQVLRQDYRGTVYVIDDASSYELDDGISIDNEGLEDGKHWVHCHIADPTSSLLPTDPISQDASEIAESLYLRSGRLSMLPDDLGAGLGCKDPVEQAKAPPPRCVTFSALVNAQGHVEQTQVSLRRLHNVHITTYDEVDEILSSTGDAEHSRKHQLDSLHRVSRLLREARQRAGAFDVTGNMVRATFNDSDDDDFPLILPSSATIREPERMISALNGGKLLSLDELRKRPPTSDAVLEVSREHSKIATSKGASTSMVSECMILAGRIAADFLWRFAKNVPAPFREQSLPSSVESKWKETIRHLTKDGEPLNMSDLLRAGVELPSAVYRATPGEHVALGISSRYERSKGSQDVLEGSGYCRATSPLRRYEDMVVHWQIKGVLHQRCGSTARGSPWSLNEMKEMLPSIQRGSERASNVGNQSERFWAHRALRLALEEAQALQAKGELPAKPTAAAAAAADQADSSSSKSDEEEQPLWRRLSPAELLEPVPAMITRPDISIMHPSMLCKARVTLTSLGGLSAQCLWPVKTVKTDTSERISNEPHPGDIVMVKLEWVREGMYGGGDIRVSLAEGHKYQ